MVVFGKGLQADFTFFVIIFVVVFLNWWIHRTRVPKLRHIAALDAFAEMAGRAAEMNRPMHAFSGGGSAWGSLYTAKGVGSVVAGLSVLDNIAKTAAKYKARLIYTSPNIESQPLVHEIMENAYKSQGVPELFNATEQIVMKSPTTYGWMANVLDLLIKEQVAAQFELGSAVGATYQILETGTRLGAIQFTSSTGRTGATGPDAFCAVVADHITLGAEAYGIGAYLTGDPEATGTLIGQDILSMLALALGVLGLILTNAGSTWLKDIMAL